MPKRIEKFRLKRSRYSNYQVIPPIKKLISTRLLIRTIELLCSRLLYIQVNLSVQLIMPWVTSGHESYWKLQGAHEVWINKEQANYHRRGQKSHAAILKWFDGLIPSQSLCVNAMPDAKGDQSGGRSNQVLTRGYDMSHWRSFSMHYKPINCFSMTVRLFYCSV